MASPPPAPYSSSSFHASMEPKICTFSVICARAPEDIFIPTRREYPNQRIPQVAKTCYSGLEQSIGAEDGKQDSPSPEPEERSNSKCSHEWILQMNRSWAVPPTRISVFILDSRVTCHVVGDMSLFSPSFRSMALTTPADTAAATYQAHDGRVLNVAGVGDVSCDNFRFPNARCVPDLCTGLNLVSVQQLAKCGYLVMLGGGQCSVMEQSSGKIVGKGRLHADDGLYHLDWLHLPHDK